MMCNFKLLSSLLVSDKATFPFYYFKISYQNLKLIQIKQCRGKTLYLQVTKFTTPINRILSYTISKLKTIKVNEIYFYDSASVAASECGNPLLPPS